MFTVLILPGKTLEIFREYEALFHDALEREQIAVCQWTPGGETIETAVPGLYDLIADKNQWRAVVVQIEAESGDEAFETDRFNPFDFLLYKDNPGLSTKDGEIVNSPVPLIRLTHLLNGLPAPEPEFEAGELNIEFKMPQFVFDLKNKEGFAERKDAFQRWIREWQLKEPPPTELLLLKRSIGKEYTDLLDRVSNSWEMHIESESSEFWKRNLYPPGCRFMTYDMDFRGALRKQKDLFSFWCAVRLICGDSVDPNALQAHRLYRLGIEFSTEGLSESFQFRVNRLTKAKEMLQKKIRAEKEMEITGAEQMPEMEVEVPVEFVTSTLSGIKIDDHEFGLFGGKKSNDSANWKQFVERVTSEIRSILKNVERSLDRAADSIRMHCGFPEKEIRTLNKYQEEDVRESLKNTFHDALENHVLLPDDLPVLREAVEEKSRKVKKQLRFRMSLTATIVTGLLSGLVLLVSLIPGFLPREETNWLSVLPVDLSETISGWISFLPDGIEQSLNGFLKPLFSSDASVDKRLLIYLTAVALVIVALTVYAVLVWQKSRLYETVGEFRDSCHETVSELTRNAESYSDFLSDVATHTHGSCYLNALEARRKKLDGAYHFNRRQMKAIGCLTEKISLWSNALQAEIDTSSEEQMEFVEDMPDITDFDSLYTLEDTKVSMVELNRMGVYMESPFEFVKKLWVVREEVYDRVGTG